MVLLVPAHDPLHRASETGNSLRLEENSSCQNHQQRKAQQICSYEGTSTCVLGVMATGGGVLKTYGV